MTDRELLEAAAKAAGVKRTIEWLGHHEYNPTWDPLTDDGDALRLAVKLAITVSINHAKGKAPAQTIVWAFGVPQFHEQHGNDACAATRRSIVRAAAAHPGPREGVDTR